MVENLDFLKCYYRPSFFMMKVDVPVDMMNLLAVTDGTFSLYFHEYIHFVQDISTIYGLMNISVITYYIHKSAHKIYHDGVKSFDIPISLKNDKNDFGYNNFKLKPIYLGSPINPKHKAIEIINYEKIEKKWGEAINEKIDFIKVSAKELENDELFEFEFGGNQVTEGMAYLCERYAFYDVLKAQDLEIPVDDYPYLVVKKLVEKIYPKLLENDLFIIASCDACLMTYHPGLSFVRLIEHFKSIDFLNQEREIKEFYVEADKLLKGSHVEFDVILETVRAEIKKNFKTEYFKGNNEWIDIIFDRIKTFRKDLPQFITDILQCGNLKENEIFGMFHKLFGSPLVLNGQDDATISIPHDFDPKDFHPNLFWSINQMLKIFSSNKPIPCEMKSYCIKSKNNGSKVTPDERCDSEPWTRCYDAELCPFAVMWRHWALSDFKPNYKLSN